MEGFQRGERVGRSLGARLAINPCLLGCNNNDMTTLPIDQLHTSVSRRRGLSRSPLHSSHPLVNSSGMRAFGQRTAQTRESFENTPPMLAAVRCLLVPAPLMPAPLPQLSLCVLAPPLEISAPVVLEGVCTTTQSSRMLLSRSSSPMVSILLRTSTPAISSQERIMSLRSSEMHATSALLPCARRRLSLIHI